MIRLIFSSALCYFVIACAGAPPPEEVEPDHGAGTIVRLAPELDALSPDEGTLYVANMRGPRAWMAWDVQSDGSITNGRVFFDTADMEGRGIPDGMKIDSEGNLHGTGPGGVFILSPEGKHLGATAGGCEIGPTQRETFKSAF